MSDIAIKAENLGKRYFIQHEKKESYETFQDILINGGKKPLRMQHDEIGYNRMQEKDSTEGEEVW